MKTENTVVTKSNVYREMFELRHNASYILNADVRKKSLSAPQLDSAESVKAAIHELTGDPKKHKNGRKEIGLLSAMKQRKDDIVTRFEKLCENAKQQGCKIPEKMPSEMFDEYCRVMATLDVRQKEYLRLQELLSCFEDEKEMERAKEKMLPYGLEQACYGEPLQEIDGQKTGMINGVMTITDSQSPYQWMPVVEYRRLAKEWITQRETERGQLRAARNAEIEKTGHSKITLPDFCARVNKKDLPKWPADIKPNMP